MRERGKISPARRLVTQLEPPTRRAVPTFGRRKAMDAARKFDEGVERVASAALSTPVPAVLVASVEDAVAQEPAPAPAHDLAPTSTMTPTQVPLTGSATTPAMPTSSVEPSQPVRRAHHAD